MDKNTLVGFALIGAVIVGFGIYNRPSQEDTCTALSGLNSGGCSETGADA